MFNHQGGPTRLSGRPGRTRRGGDSDFPDRLSDVWHEAIDFADRVYDLTASFPSTERFGLTSQMRRAAVSVSSNIAEGSGRPSGVEFMRFLGIAYGSLVETISQSHLAARHHFLDPAGLEDLRMCAEKVARMLSGLRTSLER
ncbi:MAG: four helix bundle protein [Planctomycetaceae bacterium]